MVLDFACEGAVAQRRAEVVEVHEQIAVVNGTGY